MHHKGILLVVALASLLAIAGVGAWLLLDGGQARAMERPGIPGAAR